MEVQPQLVLLQKTLLNIEGLGRELYPDLDLWATGKPFLKRWVVKQNNPQTIIKRFVDQAPAILKAMPEMPMLMHDYVQLKNKAMSQGFTGNAFESGSRMTGGSANRSLRFSIAGAAILISAALLGAATMVNSDAGLSWWVWSMGLVGVALLGLGLRNK